MRKPLGAHIALNSDVTRLVGRYPNCTSHKSGELLYTHMSLSVAQLHLAGTNIQSEAPYGKKGLISGLQIPREAPLWWKKLAHFCTFRAER